MRLAFWEEMVQSRLGPWPVRESFDITRNCHDGPIWTFDRMGSARSELPDGRTVCIGGEHEDFYDPDFCICNDVVVLRSDDQIEIYGYPKEVFPPNDFHTATVNGNRIVIIDSVGYKTERRPGFTPVYVSDLMTNQISEFKTSGEWPGWISKHKATLDEKGDIQIRGGRLIVDCGATSREQLPKKSAGIPKLQLSSHGLPSADEKMREHRQEFLCH